MQHLRQKLRLIILAYFTAFATSIPKDRHINAQMVSRSRCNSLQTWKLTFTVMFGDFSARRTSNLTRYLPTK